MRYFCLGKKRRALGLRLHTPLASGGWGLCLRPQPLAAGPRNSSPMTNSWLRVWPRIILLLWHQAR